MKRILAVIAVIGLLAGIAALAEEPFDIRSDGCVGLGGDCAGKHPKWITGESKIVIDDTVDTDERGFWIDSHGIINIPADDKTKITFKDGRMLIDIGMKWPPNWMKGE